MHLHPARVVWQTAKFVLDGAYIIKLTIMFTNDYFDHEVGVCGSIPRVEDSSGPPRSLLDPS